MLEFGRVVAGARPAQTLRIANEGTDTLRLQNITAQCNCSSARILSSVIPPGGAGEVEVTFRSDFDRGLVQKSLSIMSNDPVQKIAQVWFRADVVSYVEVTPRVLVFSAEESTLLTPKELTVTNTDTAAVTLLAVVDSAFLVRAEGARGRIEPGRSAFVRLTGNRVGEFSREGTLEIRTSNPLQLVTRVKYIIEGSRKR